MTIGEGTKSVYALIFIFLFFSLDCFSQIYSTHNYTPEDGLAARTVYDITQDSTGRMWFGTGVGISRYDGFKFENYDFTKEVNKISYRRIKTDEKGFVWSISYYTRDSIRVFKNNQWFSIPPPGISNIYVENSAIDIFYDNNNPVFCLGTSEGIFINKDNVWRRYGEENGLICNSVINVCVFDKKFYIATKKGISVFYSDSFDNSLNNIISKEPTNILKVYFQKLSVNNKEETKMWILMPNKLGYIENGIFSMLTTDFEIPDISSFISYSLVIDERDNIYFGSPYVKYYININNRKIVQLFKENGLISNGCTSIFIDIEDNLWVSDTRGLCKLNSLAFRNHNSRIGLEEDEVTAVNEISPQKYIFGHNHGITISENHKFKYISFKTLKNYKSNSSRVLDIFKDKKGNIWLSAFNMGIGKLNNTDNIEWMKVPDSTRFTSVISDEDGNIIASSDNGIYIYNKGKFEKYYNNILTNVRKLFNLNDGKIWAATSRGIYIIKNQNTKLIKRNDKFEANSIYSIFKDNKGRIFAGTQDGLYIVQNDSMIKFRENKFAIDDAVFNMVQDKNNNFWFGTNKNLVFWDGNNIIKEYNSKNGLVPGEINRSALFFDSDNRLWIGTDMGVSRYNSELDIKKSYIPKVEIISIIENGGNIISIDKDIKLGYKNNNLKFLFRGISFVNENSIEYKVKLEGFDKDWVDLNQNHIDDIKYLNLKPGDYVFKVKARNPSGEWSSEVASKIITIENPFYYKWWFILLVMVFAVTGLYGLFYHHSRTRYLSKIETEVQKRTEELAKAKNDLVTVNESLEERVKQRTNELSESESKYRSVVEQASDGIVIYDIESRKILQTNIAYCKMLGYEMDEMLSLTLYDMIAHEKESVDSFVKKIINEKIVFIGERFHKMKNGDFLPVEVSARKFCYAGNPAICVFVRDISERKKAEVALRESEERYRTLVENADDIILTYDLNFKSMQGNKKLTESLGIEKGNLADLYNRLHPDEIKDIREAQKKLLKEGRHESEFRLKQANGNWLNISGKSVVVRDSNNNPLYILSIFRDISGRKKIEQALFESEKKFRELVELLPEIVFETDKNSNVVFVNKAGLTQFDLSLEELSKGYTVLDFLAPEVHEKAKINFYKVFSGEPSKGNEYTGLKKDGSKFPVYINSVPIVKNNEPTGIRGIVVDITNQKNTEEKLLKISEEQKDLIAAKDKFFSIIAHDLRNPFTGLYGFSQVLHDEALELSSEEIVKYSGHIKDSAENLLNLLDNLLQWGRLQTGKMEARLEKINLFKKIENSISLLSHNINKKEISISNYIKNDIYVFADNFMLDSIIQNLLMNSIKFTPRKGEIEFSSDISDGFAYISLSDTGIGLSTEQIENIFRIDKRNTTLGTENEPGTGLGVILCKEMIEKQGGKLIIKSEIGKGSVFIFSLLLV